MENVYTAYTKVINDVTFYFVKKYTIFPEYKGGPKVLDSFGMHLNFYRACDIAKIHDEEIISKLLNDVNIIPETTRIVSQHGVKAISHSFVKNAHHLILKLRLVGIN